MKPSDEKRIRKLLETRQSELRRVIADTEETIRAQLAPSASGEATVDFNHPADGVTDAGDPDYEKELRLVEHQRSELGLVDEALQRLDDGDYAYCDTCGDEIPVQRLLAVPYTKHCIACRSRLERDLSRIDVRPGLFAGERRNYGDSFATPI